MNCFVIMPFSREFDDVYAAIRVAVEGAISDRAPRCFRLDEARPAGRITDRLLAELRAATLCVADLTGAKPNVMWEVGYAMALGKPTVIVVQSLRDLPFDLKDMQSLEYDRNQLSQTLTRPLRGMVVDTVGQIAEVRSGREDPQDEIIAGLRGELLELKTIVAQAVSFWTPAAAQPPEWDTGKALAPLEGTWVNVQSKSFLYGALINGDLVVPYCYGGNDRLVGVYFGWKRIGEYWFARFTWLDRLLSGFTFLKQSSVDVLTGAWWCDADERPRAPTTPPDATGVPSRLERVRNGPRPDWAERFLAEVREEGLTSRITRR
jgi:hypothetical protein